MKNKMNIKVLIAVLALVLIAVLIFVIWSLSHPKTTVTFDLAGGEMEETQIKIRYGKKYDLPVPSRKDMSFAGWLLNGQYFDSKGNEWPFKEDVTLVASWEYRDDNDVIYTPNEDGSFVIEDYKGVASNSIFVPSTYLGKPVTEIKDSAFARLKDILETVDTDIINIYIPSSVKYSDGLASFDKRAHIVEYSYVTSDKFIVLEKEDSVSIVGYQGKYYETTVIVPNKINGKPVTEIGAYTFYGASKDINQSTSSFSSRILIPETVTKIGLGAFGKCEGMKVSLYYPHDKDGFREIVALSRLYDWQESIMIGAENDHLLDVITMLRPAIGWSSFTHATYFVKLDAKGGVVYNGQNVKLEYVTFKANIKEYSLPTPVRDGYTFDGWYYGDRKIDQSGGAWLFNEHVTLTAKWTEN